MCSKAGDLFQLCTVTMSCFSVEWGIWYFKIKISEVEVICGRVRNPGHHFHPRNIPNLPIPLSSPPAPQPPPKPSWRPPTMAWGSIQTKMCISIREFWKNSHTGHSRFYVATRGQQVHEDKWALNVLLATKPPIFIIPGMQKMSVIWACFVFIRLSTGPVMNALIVPCRQNWFGYCWCYFAFSLNW